MSSTIQKYFGRYSQSAGKNKRGLSSSSSASDVCVSPEASESIRGRQEKKKLRQERRDSTEDMADQVTLQEISETMKQLSTKEDLKREIKTLREEVERLTASLTGRIEKLEGSVFDLEKENDKLRAEVSTLKGEQKEIRGQLSQQCKEASNMRRAANDHEQHGRQWNLRVFGVPESQREETVEDCAKSCINIFTKKLGVSVTASDVEIAHRSGRKEVGGGRPKPRPILIRFFSRKQRGLVLAARKKLKQSGISVAEDLTQANYKLLQKVNTHSATMASWSSNGKILAKLKNGKTFRVDIDTNVDAMFVKEMA